MSSEHPYRVPYRVETYGKDFLRPRGYQVVLNRTGEIKDRFPFDYNDRDSIRQTQRQANLCAGIVLDFDYTVWLDEVEQRAIRVNQRRFTGLNKFAAIKAARDYLALFRRFIAVNRSILHASRVR